MWRTDALRRVYTLNTWLNSQGFGNVQLLRTAKRATRKMLERALRRGATCSINIDGMILEVPSTPASFNDYVLCPYEPYMTTLFRQAVRTGTTVLDIGAQFGYFSLIAAKRGASVIAFEPAPSNVALLEKNVRANGLSSKVKIVPSAVGRKDTKANLFVYRDSDSHGMYPVPDVPVKDVINLDCVEVDTFLEGQAVDVIKIDIEGHEPFALEGMKKTLQNGKRLVLFAELAPAFLRRAGVTPAHYLNQLESFKFQVQMIDEQSKCLRDITIRQLSEIESDTGFYTNLYCTKCDCGK
jgi:FkbM family methyltransferase